MTQAELHEATAVLCQVPIIAYKCSVEARHVVCLRRCYVSVLTGIVSPTLTLYLLTLALCVLIMTLCLLILTLFSISLTLCPTLILYPFTLTFFSLIVTVSVLNQPRPYFA